MSLASILASCSATRYTAAGPTRPEDLAKYAILFEQQPSGQVTHTWKLLSEIDLTQYQYPWGATQISGQLERITDTPMTDDQISEACDQVMKRCLDVCMARPFPSWASHISSRFPNTPAGRNQAKAVLCQQECAKERNACYQELRRKRQEAVKFSSAERAIDWVKRNKTELLVGTVIVIAGVAFVAFVCGSGGCLILIPITLIASNDVPTEPYTAEAWQ